MTIEIENTDTGKKRVAEYRTFIDNTTPNSQTVIKNRDVITLDRKQGSYPYNYISEEDPTSGIFVIADIISPDVIRILDLEFGYTCPTESNVKELTKDEINDANLESKTDPVRVIWRETQPDDYPPPPQNTSVVTGR
jgi:hypothetical protein